MLGIKRVIEQKSLSKSFPTKTRLPSSVKKLMLTKIDQTSKSANCKPGSGRDPTAWIAQNVDSVEELVLSQAVHQALTK